jgi:hypothetical protein
VYLLETVHTIEQYHCILLVELVSCRVYHLQERKRYPGKGIGHDFKIESENLGSVLYRSEGHSGTCGDAGDRRAVQSQYLSWRLPGARFVDCKSNRW